MGSNTFGNLFKIVTWGESHGPAVGVVIDGCPAGLELYESDISAELQKRKAGSNPHTSPRREPDLPQILSGVFENQTTGAPISILIPNLDVDSSKYEPIKNLLRPGHANYTYLEKYGIFDYRGGGRASARETACRVAAGAVAKKLLRHFHIDLVAFLKEAACIPCPIPDDMPLATLKDLTSQSPLFCPDPTLSQTIAEKIEATKRQGDSVGGIIELRTTPLPTGLGDPVYEKLEANLAKALLSLPAAKGIEFGSGFAAARAHGSTHNDLFTLDPQNHIITTTNHSGGLLGGISNGMPLTLRVAFKPTSSITHDQPTLTLDKQPATFTLPPGSRHDPCVALRAPPIVEAMTALVLADALLLNRSSRL